MDPVRRVNTTMPESLLSRVDLYSELNLEDRATAIRQLVAEGLRTKLQDAVLDRYRKRSMTLRQAAEMLGVTYLEMDEILRESGIPLMDDPNIARGGSARKRRRSHAAQKRLGPRRAL